MKGISFKPLKHRRQAEATLLKLTVRGCKYIEIELLIINKNCVGQTPYGNKLLYITHFKQEKYK